MFYVKEYYTDLIIDTFDNVMDAIQKSKGIPDSIVIDENDNDFYINIELPF